MIWPWSRPEVREADSYTDLVIAGLTEAAGRTAGPSVSTGAVQAAAQLWARALAACAADHPAVTPEVLGAIGYSLGTGGESLHVIDVDPGALAPRLTRASDWTVYGASDPASWRYSATLSGPSTTVVRMVEAAGAVHVRYLADDRRPWCGIPPWRRVPMLAELAAEVEAALTWEARQPVQSIVPIPQTQDAETLRERLMSRVRRLSLPESTSKNFGVGGNPPQTDWKPHRLKPDPAAGLVTLCREIPTGLAAVYGIPRVLVAGDGTETPREGWRRFTAGTIAPLAKLIGAVLSAALDTAVTIDTRPLRGADVAGAARAYHVLREGGMSDQDALENAGLS